MCAVIYWQRIVQPLRFTSLYADEFAPIIASFTEREGSLETQLDPEQILTVATREYLPVFEQINTALHCPECDRFWVTFSADVTALCVLGYSASQSTVRATVTEMGYTVDATTYEPLQAEAQLQDRATYHLVKQNGGWKVARITDWTPTTKGQADGIGVLQEYLAELGCK